MKVLLRSSELLGLVEGFIDSVASLDRIQVLEEDLSLLFILFILV